MLNHLKQFEIQIQELKLMCLFNNEISLLNNIELFQIIVIILLFII